MLRPESMLHALVLTAVLVTDTPSGSLSTTRLYTHVFSRAISKSRRIEPQPVSSGPLACARDGPATVSVLIMDVLRDVGSMTELPSKNLTDLSCSP
ncbi:hypothetical protein B0T19DRAFT_102452 [Cercophora scortea]|uniref:Secreted protein n=1 Tax=Cercophora scortea TaxID=314031 RepID=A0AAE0MH46_9PEZI|nr:hypothetical protein B0T19DRAFT_102452 [Cercophora scortea]